MTVLGKACGWASLRGDANAASTRSTVRRPFGLTPKVLAPMTLLTLLCAALGGFILVEGYRSHTANLEQKKGELARHVYTVYAQSRAELLDVANLMAENADIQNGLLIGDQYNALNNIMNFLGHAGIDIINIYDLDGRAFARAQSPSYFGDYDEFAPLIRSSIVQENDKQPTSTVGIAMYQGNPVLVAIRPVRGVSGATGMVVVGHTFTKPFLNRLVPAKHSAISLSRNGSTLTAADDATNMRITGRLIVEQEKPLVGNSPFEINLLTDDSALSEPFWGERAAIITLAAVAALGSVIITFIFMFITVVRPVRHLIAVAEQQVSGDLAARVRVNSRDELGRLGEILNVLTDNLKTTLDQLEARVEQRTRELQLELNQRKRAQAALVKAKDEAEAANASKSRFLAAASHDLRQPVHAMTLFVSNLAQQVESLKAKDTVTNINACVESLCEMFDKILDVTKLAAGVIEPQIQDFPIDRLFGRLQREFEGLASQRKIEFRCIRSKLTLRSDPALLYRILSNLISNALKNTEEGRILLGCRRRGDGAEIQIWDTGVGIPESEINYIFEEFYRGTNRKERRATFGFGAGLGLGLSIVEHTASLLKHPVHVSSSPGRTMFSVRLPYGTGESLLSLRDEDSDNSFDVAGSRILVVDDHALALKAVQSTLENWGCKVAAASSSDEAMQILSNGETPQVLIVDYLLQNGDTGVNLLRKLGNGLGIRVPAIVLSGVSSRLLEREVEECGYRLLYKPASPARLRQMLIECLGADIHV